MRLFFFSLMLAFSVGMTAQQHNADKLYQEGLTLQRIQTVESQNNAIKKFIAAKALYSTKANQDKCARQINACKNTIKNITKPTSRTITKTSQGIGRSEAEIRDSIESAFKTERNFERAEELYKEGCGILENGSGDINSLCTAKVRLESAKEKYTDYTKRKLCDEKIEICDKGIAQLREQQKIDEQKQKEEQERAQQEQDEKEKKFKELIEKEAAEKARQKAADDLYRYGLTYQQTMKVDFQEKAKSLFEQARDNYVTREDQRKCESQIEVCTRNINKIRKRKNFNCPYYGHNVAGWSIGYVQKQWALTDVYGTTTKTGIWDTPKWVRGLQTGIRIEPLFKYGFALDTGIYYEFYYSKGNAEVYNGDSYHPILMEHSFYVPMHLEYRLNLTRKFQLFFYGGIGGDIGVKANLKTDNKDIYFTEKNGYKAYDDVWTRWNVSYEFGAGVCFSHVQLNFTMSKGIFNMSDIDNVSSKVNKMMTSMSFMF